MRILIYHIFVLSLIGIAFSDDDKNTCEKSSVFRSKGGITTINIRMPKIHTKKHDQYVCVKQEVPDDNVDQFIVKFTPHLKAKKAHHMLFFGCEGVPKQKVWSCEMGQVCTGSKTLYAWARDAKELHLPKDVGFKVGKSNKIKYFVMQIHYQKAMKPGQTDCSGLTITTTRKKQPKLAGIYLLGATQISVPPHGKGFGSASCINNVPASLHVFAFRTHAHGLGRVITGYRVRDGKTKMIGKGNPQWPQAFYTRVGGEIDIKKGDDLMMRCDYKSNRNRWTYVGSTGEDEMCNFYMMFYTENQKEAYTHQCWGDALHLKFPATTAAMCPYPGFAGIDSTMAILQHKAKEPKVPAEMHMKGDHSSKEDKLQTSNKDSFKTDSDSDSILDQLPDKNNLEENDEEDEMDLDYMP